MIMMFYNLIHLTRSHFLTDLRVTINEFIEGKDKKKYGFRFDMKTKR